MTALHSVMFLLAQSTDEAPHRGASWLQIIKAGGLVGYVIIALSMVMITMIVIHIMQIRRNALMPPQQRDVIDNLLARGEVNAALEYCMNPENVSYFTRILGAGLTRFQRSAFGPFEIKNAIEEAGEEQTARLYRSTDVLGVIGSIGPLLGLLGTVLGMVNAFQTLGEGATPDHKALSQDLSLALVTTLLGLCVAIPAVVLFSFFRNRIDALASEVAQEIERVVIHLESTGGAPSAPQPPAQRAFVPRAAAPVPSPRPVAPSAPSAPPAENKT
ncbi:MAG TPA: MotA/TolQ/ExbB proton channel family protein [Phycisphaerales bacterium]|nr:MotA/TolQ/ExbB proton channel family protein [Phycisphaerales bacterium]